MENRAAAAQAKVLKAIPEGWMTQVEDQTEFLPGFWASLLPGHTPGQMGLLIEAAGERMLHIADAARNALQCQHPDWSPGFNSDPDQSRRTRRQLWQRAARENLLVMGYHLVKSGRGHIISSGSAWMWQPVVA